MQNIFYLQSNNFYNLFVITKININKENKKSYDKIEPPTRQGGFQNN